MLQTGGEINSNDKGNGSNLFVSKHQQYTLAQLILIEPLVYDIYQIQSGIVSAFIKLSTYAINYHQSAETNT